MSLNVIKKEVEEIIAKTEITGIKCSFCSDNDKIKEDNEAVSKAVNKLRLGLAEKGCFNLDLYQDEDDIIVVNQYDILLEGMLYTYNKDIDGNYHCMEKNQLTDFEV